MQVCRISSNLEIFLSKRKPKGRPSLRISILKCLSHDRLGKTRHHFTPASNLGYLAPPGQFFMGAKLFIGTPWMGNEGVLKKILVWAI